MAAALSQFLEPVAIPETNRTTKILKEAGGIGFSEPLFRVHDILLHRTRELIAGCGCESGCPSCVGPAGDKCEKTKEAALAILNRLCA